MLHCYIYQPVSASPRKPTPIPQLSPITHAFCIRKVRIIYCIALHYCMRFRFFNSSLYSYIFSCSVTAKHNKRMYLLTLLPLYDLAEQFSVWTSAVNKYLFIGQLLVCYSEEVTVSKTVTTHSYEFTVHTKCFTKSCSVQLRPLHECAIHVT